jgi:hypothetical protein
MAQLDLTLLDAECILSGDVLPGRVDLGALVELTTFVRISSQIESAPPMSAGLLGQIAGPATN